MIHYGGKSPKRHYAFANSVHIRGLFAGKLMGWVKHKEEKERHGKKVGLVDKYVDKNGVKRWKGNKNLRSSEMLACIIESIVSGFSFLTWLMGLCSTSSS